MTRFTLRSGSALVLAAFTLLAAACGGGSSSSSSSAATVPPGLKIAVIANDASAHVFVVDGGKAHKRDVTLGVEHGEQVQVLAGVEPGATVVTLGQQSLKDGDAVQVVSGEKAVAGAESTASL